MKNRESFREISARAEISGDGSGETLAPLPDDSYPAGAQPLKVAPPMQVAYHLGPPDLTYCGRLWYRGKPQSVTESEWSAMRARADFAHFDFRVQ